MSDDEPEEIDDGTDRCGNCGDDMNDNPHGYITCWKCAEWERDMLRRVLKKLVDDEVVGPKSIKAARDALANSTF